MPPNYSFVTQRHRLGLLAESAEYELVKEGRIPDQFQANLMKPLHSLVKVEKTLKSLTFPTNNLASGSHPIHVLVSASSRSKDAKPNERFDDFEEKIPTPLLRECSLGSGDDKSGDGPPPPPSQVTDQRSILHLL